MNENSKNSTLQEIFSTIRGHERDLKDSDARDAVEGGYTKPSFKNLDRLLGELQTSISAEEATIFTQEKTEVEHQLSQLMARTPDKSVEGDEFPEPPLSEAVAKLHAAREYAEDMVELSLLRSKGVRIPGFHELNAAFTDAGTQRGDIAAQRSAEYLETLPARYREGLSFWTEEEIKKRKQVLEYLERVEKSGKGFLTLDLVLKAITSEIEANKHEERGNSPYIDNNVISLRHYVLSKT